MPYCPRCHQLVDSQAVSCPHCKMLLKAHGHPGIPLHHASEETFLCSSCTYDEDDTCTLPQRPYAKTCTLYHNRLEPLTEAKPVYKMSLSGLLRRYRGWLILVILILISIVVALT